MMRSMYCAPVLFAFAAVAALPRLAYAGDDGKLLWGNHAGVLSVEPYVVSGTVLAQKADTAPTPGTPAVGAGYSQTRVQATFHAGFYAAETMFKTLLGFEFKGAIGYGGSYNKDADSTINFRFDMLASYALLRWRGPLPGRLVFAPGVGLDSDSGRPYQAGYVYPSLGGRLIVHPGQVLDGRLMYDFVPSVSGDLRLTSHQFGAGFNYKSLGVGARLQLNRITIGANSSTETSFGGSAGFAF